MGCSRCRPRSSFRGFPLMFSTRRLLTFLLAAAFANLSASLALAGAGDKRLDIYWVDVEGGAATLIVTPAGESILIDSGNPGRRDPDRIVKVATTVAGLK